MITSKSLNWRFRLKAALIHLGASAALALIVAGVVFLLWYPGDYRSMSGGTELFLIVVSVDVVIGPLITLAIFDRRKSVKSLSRDMAVVALLQLGALGYGLNTVSIARPVALALEVDRFRVVAANDVYLPELPAAAPDFQKLPLTGPRLVSSTLPQETTKRNEALSLGFKGYDIGTRPSLWTPWDQAARATAVAHAKPLSALIARYPDRKTTFDTIVADTGRTADQLVFIPTITLRDDWVTLLDATSGVVVGFAPFDGF